jgi:hypothetical protein|tara:strand:- start:998 stop:1423 length:426 start_codon:yes stop_codon:yes gene_type:complete
MSEGWLEIMNLKKLINFSRRVIYYNFDESNVKLDDDAFLDKVDKIASKEDDSEMDKLLPYKEVETIFGEFLHRREGEKAWFIKDGDYDVILVNISERMVSNIVRDLVNKGLVESAFDSDKNDFVFWVKGNDDEDTRKKKKK